MTYLTLTLLRITLVMPNMIGPFQEGDPFKPFTDKMIASLQGLMIPGGVIGILFVILAFIVEPAFPGLTNTQRGYIQKALFAVAVAGFVPTIVTAFAALGRVGS